jgi:hypothetical protein
MASLLRDASSMQPSHAHADGKTSAMHTAEKKMTISFLNLFLLANDEANRPLPRVRAGQRYGSSS